MPIAVSKAYALGLLAALQRQAASLAAVAMPSATALQAIKAQIGQAQHAYMQAVAAAQTQRQQAQHVASQLSEDGSTLQALAREIKTLEARAESFNQAAQQSDDAAVQLQLRRRRAALMVQATGRRTRVTELQQAGQSLQAALQARRAAQQEQQAASRNLLQQRRALQAQLPRPSLYVELFTQQAAQAHCLFVLDADVAAWRQAMQQACGHMTTLHTALAEGLYDVEVHSALAYGRAPASAVALYAWGAMGAWSEVRRLFAVAAAADKFFEDIDTVFHLWCLGLYLTGEKSSVVAMLQRHAYAAGQRGSLARAFLALYAAEAGAFDAALRSLVQQDWYSWQQHPQRALGLINTTALTLCRLANRVQLAWNTQALLPTVPQALWASPRDIAG